MRRKNDREEGGVVARGLRERRLAALLREAGEWAREEGARICEVSSFANTGVRELRTLLDSMGGAPACRRSTRGPTASTPVGVKRGMAAQARGVALASQACTLKTRRK